MNTAAKFLTIVALSSVLAALWQVFAAHDVQMGVFSVALGLFATFAAEKRGGTE